MRDPTRAVAVPSFVLAAGASVAWGGLVIDGPEINPANGNSYFLLDAASWTESQSQAELLGGNLVTINDALENDWVFETFGSGPEGRSRNLWLGLHDPDGDNQNYVWVDGTPVTFTNYAPGEPNNGGEPYIAMYPSSRTVAELWNDRANSSIVDGGQPFGVVEVIVPAPATAPLLALGALAARRRRRA